jgi:hypothetical protein
MSHHALRYARNINSDGTIDILYYGYGALAAKVPNGAQFNNLA